jgi:hypothetical protein
MRYSCSTPGHPLSLTTGSRKHPLDQLPDVLSKMTGCGSRYERFRQTVTRDGCRWCRVRTQVRTGAESAAVNSASFGRTRLSLGCDHEGKTSVAVSRSRAGLGLQPACQVISEEPRSFQSGLLGPPASRVCASLWEEKLKGRG